MSITEHPLYSSFSALAGNMRKGHQTVIVGLTSTQSQTGTSYTARELALLAAQYYTPHGQRVALIDFDLGKQSQKNFFENPISQTQYGAIAGPYDASFGQHPFWQISHVAIDSGPQIDTDPDIGLFGIYLVGETGLGVTFFDWTKIRAGQTVQIVTAPEYWRALRDQFAMVIVDCPAFDRSDTALNIISELDSMVLVTSPSAAQDQRQSELLQLISDNGGYCPGQIINAGALQSHPLTFPAS